MAAAATAKPTNGTGPEKPPRDVTSQASYSGTNRGRDGLAQPDDYVRELADLPTRMETFEEMGKSDDAIGIALEARTQEILSANWALSTADETPSGADILAFCEDNIYPHIDRILRLIAKSRLQYGFGLIEPVYAWSDTPFTSSISRGELARPTMNPGERRIYLRRIAHIRPTAVTAFRIDENGELISVHQEVFDGTRFRNIDIPAEKLLLSVFGQEGDDYSGVPAIRHLYKAFSFKRQIERLTVLHFDKFATGVPQYEEPPEGCTPAERALALEAGKKWRSGGEQALTTKNGGGWSIITASGEIAASGLLWKQHYDGMSAKSLSTQQMELGSTPTGSRAVGETFAAQLGGASQADCEDIANLINNALIVPLVKWNFGAQENYPAFAPSQRTEDAGTQATAVQAFSTAGFLHARPEDEVAIRDSLGLPDVKVETLKAEADARTAKADAIANAAAAAPKQPGDTAPPAPADKKPPLKVAATRDVEPEQVHRLAAVPLAPGAPPAAVKGESTYRTREFSVWEQGILRPDLLSRDLDMHATRLASEVQDAFAAIDADLEKQVTRAADLGPEALQAAVKTIAVPDRLKKQLRVTLLDAAERVRAYGGAAVRNEIIRQVGPTGIGPARADEPMGWYARAVGKLRTLAASPVGKTPFDLHLEAEIDNVVENEIDRREGAARTSVTTAIASMAAAAGASLASIVSGLIKKGLESLSIGRTESSVKGVVNVAFGIGRTEEAQAINTAAGAVIPAAEKSALPSSSPGTPGAAVPATRGAGGGTGNRSGLVDANGAPIELVSKVYSAVMDFGTRDECAKWDGAEFPIDYPEDPTGVQAPNPRCFGGITRCRCVWIYVTSEETPPTVPAAKGPAPVLAPTFTPFTREQLTDAITLALEPQLAAIRDQQKGTATQPITLNVTLEAPKPGSSTRKLVTPRGEFTITTGVTDDAPTDPQAGA